MNGGGGGWGSDGGAGGVRGGHHPQQRITHSAQKDSFNVIRHDDTRGLYRKCAN